MGETWGKWRPNNRTQLCHELRQVLMLNERGKYGQTGRKAWNLNRALLAWEARDRDAGDLRRKDGTRHISQDVNEGRRQRWRKASDVIDSLMTHVRGFILQVYTPRGVNGWSHAGTACVRYVPAWGRYTVWGLEPPLSGCSPIKKINKQGKWRCACEPSRMAEEAGLLSIYGVLIG